MGATKRIVLFFIIGYACGQCPDSASILPCTCTSGNGVPPSMGCIGITSEDQLEQIFSADFPETNMVEIKIEQSSLDQLSRNVFGPVSFQSIYIDSYYVRSISDDAFENSKTSLITLSIKRCKVSQDSFPFSSLDTYTALDSIEFERNEITAFPQLSSETLNSYAIMQNTLGVLSSVDLATISNLTNLYLTDCGVTAIEEGAFESSSELSTLSMEQNPISTLPTSVFHNLPNLLSLFMGYNQITALEPEIFNNGTTNVDFVAFNNNNLTTISTDTFKALGYQTYIRLNDNMISTVEDNAFGSITNSTINLMNNQLTELQESWMRPLLQRYCVIYMDGNPFTCGCEIAWLFEEPNFQLQVTGQCPDGTSISELDPEYFEDNCNIEIIEYRYI